MSQVMSSSRRCWDGDKSLLRTNTCQREGRKNAQEKSLNCDAGAIGLGQPHGRAWSKCCLSAEMSPINMPHSTGHQTMWPKRRSHLPNEGGVSLQLRQIPGRKKDNQQSPAEQLSQLPRCWDKPFFEGNSGWLFPQLATLIYALPLTQSLFMQLLCKFCSCIPDWNINCIFTYTYRSQVSCFFWRHHITIYNAEQINMKQVTIFEPWMKSFKS